MGNRGEDESGEKSLRTDGERKRKVDELNDAASSPKVEEVTEKRVEGQVEDESKTSESAKKKPKIEATEPDDKEGDYANAPQLDSESKKEGAQEGTETKPGLSPTIIELEKKRTSLLQKLGAAPNLDEATTSVLQDVGTGLRYGRYATTHKPKPKAKSKGWQFHYNKETGGSDKLEKEIKKKKKKKKKKSSRRKTKSTTTTTTTTTSATMVAPIVHTPAPPPPAPAYPQYSTYQSYDYMVHHPPPPSPYLQQPQSHMTAGQPYPQYNPYTLPPYAAPPPPPPPPSFHPYPSHTNGYQMAPPPAAAVSSSLPHPYSSHPGFSLQQQQPPQSQHHHQQQQQQQQHQHQQQKQQLRQTQYNSRPSTPTKALVNEAHLNFVTTALSFIDNYKQHLWPFAPLPAAVLEESTARYFLTTAKGAEEQSLLALCFHICLCRGAMLAGDVGVCIDYYNKADQIAQYYEGTGAMANNYAYAAALLSMSQHGQCFMLDTDKTESYLKTAMRICVKKNILNSDIYLRCLYMVVFRPNGKVSDVKNLNKEVEKLKSMPYFALGIKTTVAPGGIVYSEDGEGGISVDQVPMGDVGSGVGESVNSNMSDRAGMGANGYYRNQMHPSDEDQLLDLGRYLHSSNGGGGSMSATPHNPYATDMIGPPPPITLYNLNAINSVFVVVATVQRGMSLYRNEVENADPDAVERLRDSLLQLLELTEKLVTEVKMIQLTSGDPLPQSIVRFVKLFSLATRAECKQMARDYDAAVDWACKFLMKTKKPAYRFAFEGASRFVSYVLGIFSSAQQTDLFKQQIAAIDNWIKLVPMIRSTIISFTNRGKGSKKRAAAKAAAAAKPAKKTARTSTATNPSSTSHRRNSNKQSAKASAAASAPASRDMDVVSGPLGGVAMMGVNNNNPGNELWQLNQAERVAAEGLLLRPSSASSMNMLLDGSGNGDGEDLFQQLDTQKEKRRLLKEKIEVMQGIMAQLKKRPNNNGTTATAMHAGSGGMMYGDPGMTLPVTPSPPGIGQPYYNLT